MGIRAIREDTLRAVSLIKSASLVSVLTLLSRVTGLARELLIASFFGASALTDAFNVAFRIPNLLRRLFAEGAFSQAFVPVLAATRETQGEHATKVLIDRVATLLTLALFVTCVVGVVAAPGLVWLMASGLEASPDSFNNAVYMTRWMFPYIGFMSLVALSAGILNTWRRFGVPAVTPVLLNFSMIFAAWLGAPWFKSMGWEPIHALAFGVLLGGLLQLSIQIPALLQIGLLPRIHWSWSEIVTSWRDPGTRNILALMAPALLGVGVAQLSLLINTQIASHLRAGSVSWLSYADRLMEFPTALLGVALGVVLMPQLAAAKAANDGDKFSSMLDWGLRLVVMSAAPCAVVLLVFSHPLVAVLYHYGAFNANDVEQTSNALMGYGVGLIGLIAIKVLAPGFYASQDIRTPVKIAIFVLICTQLLNTLFVPYFAHAGLALAIGVGALINAGLLWVGLLRSGRYSPLPGWTRFLLQTLIACALMGAVLYWANAHWDWTLLKASVWTRMALVAGALLVAGLVYLVALISMGMNLRALLRA